jgi:orotidine-5'-phosphate decarboxylase
MPTQLIVALDVPTLTEARWLVRELKGVVKIFKVGSELFTAAGPAAVKMVRQHGAQVFLDLKFHDIPNTVARAVESAAQLGVSMLTVHTSGGEEMLRAAVAASVKCQKLAPFPSPLVLGVTVLTSMNQQTLAGVGVERAMEDQVELLARLAQRSGLGGLVCSPLELKRLRAVVGAKMKIVTPGIRPLSSSAEDQSRVATPAAAARAGADYIVVGRPIAREDDPRAAALAIRRELRSAACRD